MKVYVPRTVLLDGREVEALLPIEAEEERTRPVHLYAATVHVSPTSSSDKPSRRLVTPWEEVPPAQD